MAQDFGPEQPPQGAQATLSSGSSDNAEQLGLVLYGLTIEFDDAADSSLHIPVHRENLEGFLRYVEDPEQGPLVGVRDVFERVWVFNTAPIRQVRGLMHFAHHLLARDEGPDMERAVIARLAALGVCPAHAEVELAQAMLEAQREQRVFHPTEAQVHQMRRLHDLEEEPGALEDLEDELNGVFHYRFADDLERASSLEDEPELGEVIDDLLERAQDEGQVRGFLRLLDEDGEDLCLNLTRLLWFRVAPAYL